MRVPLVHALANDQSVQNHMNGRSEMVEKPAAGQTLRFYRISEVIGDRKRGVAGIIPVSRASWYAGIKDGRYPKPVKLSERTAAWRSTDIDELVARLSAAGK